MDKQTAPALKEIFNLTRLTHIAEETAAVYPAFDKRKFMADTSAGLAELSLMARLQRVSTSLHARLPASYPQALKVLRKLAPRLNSRFVTMILPEYVARYGQDDFDLSMDVLKFFTSFGSSEFGVRYFLRLDLHRALKTMEVWSRDEDEHVRRLASEGSRPRLPWSFRIEPLMADPSPALPILENLKADTSLYVRKSVANHLNDITKDNPGWALATIEGWPLSEPHTAWIARHALRSLIKKGDKRALTIVGAGDKAEVLVRDLQVHPRRIRLGEKITVSFRLESMSEQPQRLVVDYAIHYVKNAGSTSAKVFKLKALTLDGGASASIARQQHIRDFTTRAHYAGKHGVDILVNGECLAQGFFDLQT